MHTTRSGIAGAALLAAVMIPAALAAQTARERLLVQPADIDLSDPDLVLLHVGDTADYRAAHLPGAQFVNREDFSTPHDMGSGALMLEMPDAATLKAVLESYGITDGSNIVVYMGKDWVTPAARIVFTLDYAGLGESTRLLDGGMPAWQAAGRPVTTEVPAARQGRLGTLRERDDRIVDREWLKAHMGDDGYALVDARSRAVYDGVQADQGRNGHIPGAGSLPWVELYDGTSAKLKSPDEVRALFEAAGVKPGDIVVGYCHIGQYATAMLFAARTLGYDVRLYDGSFQDWARDPASPVEPTRGPGS